MARNWDAEWHSLIGTEREAFEEMLAAQAELTKVFARYDKPDTAMLDNADAARARWKSAQSAIDKFLDDFRKS